MSEVKKGNELMKAYNNYKEKACELIEGLRTGDLVPFSVEPGGEVIIVSKMDAEKIKKEYNKNDIDYIHRYTKQNGIINTTEEFFKGHLTILELIIPEWIKERKSELIESMLKNYFVLYPTYGVGMCNLIKVLMK